MFSNGVDHHTTEKNKGLTLVELLVAVVIFAIAIIPMLYAFVYATGYNFRAQQTLQSTGIAQAIIEKAKSPGFTMDELESSITSAHDILDTTIFSVGTFPTTSETDSITGGTLYRLDNVKAINLTEDDNNRRVYDVEVVLSPNLSVTSSVIRSMSDSTANFTDNTSSFSSSMLLYEDQRAVDKLIDLIKSNVFSDSNITVKDSSGVTVAPTSWPVPHPGVLFSDSDIDRDNLIIRRVININCVGSGADKGVSVSVDYYCGGFYVSGLGGSRTLSSTFQKSITATISGSSYTISCDGNLDDATNTYSVITSSNYAGGGDAFYHATYNGNTSFPLITDATDALFFYYYPGYESEESDDIVDFYDSFVISNDIKTSDIASGSEGNFDMYFYKQYNDSLTTAQLNWGENHYAPFFKFSNSASSDMTINFYNNFLYDVRNTDRYDNSALLSAHSETFANALQSDGTSTLITYTGSFNNRTLPPSGAGLYDWDGANMTPYRTGVLSTYNIIVRVYKDGDTTPIESMSGEVINW